MMMSLMKTRLKLMVNDFENVFFFEGAIEKESSEE